VIEKHCSEQLVTILKKNNILGIKNRKKKKDANLLDDYEEKNFFINFWNKYKVEIDNVINELNQLYSILLNSVKDITYVFEYPFKLIEDMRENTKINIESFIKDKFFDIICNDELIKTLIHEIKRNQNKSIIKEKKEVDIDRLTSSPDVPIIEIHHTNNNHSTCDDNDVENNSEESIDDEKENSLNAQRTKYNKEVEDENNYKDLNKLMDYINEDDNDNKSSPKKKSKNMKTQNNNNSNQTKKKKKSRKNINATDYTKDEKIKEEDKTLIEFKIKLENESLNAREKEKVKPLYSKRFLNYISSHLIKN